MGPLAELHVIEFAGIGPGPFAAMMLADMGADIVRVDRAGSTLLGLDYDVLNRGRRSIVLDLKRPEAVEAALRLVEKADALIEGFRPGVMERLGLGPDACLARNPRLAYGRVTGWGQEGPLAQAAGHDINYIALSGALHAIGTQDGGPAIPLNLIGDFGGGGMLLAFGLVCAVLEARASGKGQVVDAAMTDGAAALMAMIYGMAGNKQWTDRRQANLLDGGAPFYATYRCADGKWVAVGALEPQFYALLLDKIGLEDPMFRAQSDRSMWPRLRAALADAFARRTRQEWCEVLQGTDACFAPVLDLAEAAAHPHNASRGTLEQRDGVVQPAPAPRFSRTPAALRRPPPQPGEHGREILAEHGFSAAEIRALQDAGALSLNL
ncbi:MAG: CoA transferase [Acetobacteraceae bacterium]|nr:CoA transferase [Acetobacteraceae bacterium]